MKINKQFVTFMQKNILTGSVVFVQKRVYIRPSIIHLYDFMGDKKRNSKAYQLFAIVTTNVACIKNIRLIN